MKLLELFQLLDEAALLEARVDYLKDTFAEKLSQKSEMEPDVIFNQFVEADPSPQKKFTQWLIQIYLKDNLNIKDLPNAPDYIRFFIANARKLPVEQRNIASYKSLQELVNAMQPLMDAPAELEKRMMSKEHSKIIYNSPTLSVIIPLSQQASCYFGVSAWCTANKNDDHNHFDEYNNKGYLYVIYLKDIREKYQYHPATGEFKDGDNETANIIEILSKYPELKTAFGSKLMAQITLSNMPTSEYKNFDWSSISDDDVANLISTKPMRLVDFPPDEIRPVMWDAALLNENDDIHIVIAIIDLYVKIFGSLADKYVKYIWESNPDVFEYTTKRIPMSEPLALQIASQYPAMAVKVAPYEVLERMDLATKPNLVGKIIPTLEDTYNNDGLTIEVIGRMTNVFEYGNPERSRLSVTWGDDHSRIALGDKFGEYSFFAAFIGRFSGADYASDVVYNDRSRHYKKEKKAGWLPDVDIEQLSRDLVYSFNPQMASLVYDTITANYGADPDFDVTDLKALYYDVIYYHDDAEDIREDLYLAVIKGITDIDKTLPTQYAEYIKNLGNNITPSQYNPYDNWNIEVEVDDRSRGSRGYTLMSDGSSLVGLTSQLEMAPKKLPSYWDNMFVVKDFAPVFDMTFDMKVAQRAFQDYMSRR